MENCYRTLLEARTDWLALQIMYVKYDTNRDDGPHLDEERAALSIDVRQSMEEACYKLSEQAIQNKQLLMSDMADELAKFYQVLPQDMFRKKQPHQKAVVPASNMPMRMAKR